MPVVDNSWSVQNSDFTYRFIGTTTLPNQQSISADDFTMRVGDPTPTVDDFKASATDKDGNAIKVSVDLSKADLSTPGTYDVVLTAADGQTKTVKLTVLANQQSLNGSDFTAYVGDPKPTVADFKASATDKDGKAVDVTADLSKVDMQKAGTYDVVLTAADGQTKTVKLTVLANQQSLNGSDVTAYVGDPKPTVADFKASATDKDGKAVDVTADLSKVDMQKAGTYDVVLTAADGQTKTVELTVLANQQSFAGSDVTAYVGDPKPALADFKASATGKDGKAVDVTADLSKVNMQKAGTYDVVLTAADGQTKTVELTVLANQQSFAGSNVTAYVGDPKPTLADFKASATDKDGKAVDVTANLSSVDMQKAGTYKIILTAADGRTKTVELTILANQQSLNGSDVTAYVGDPKPTLADFKASATGKDGKAVTVTADLSNVDMQKAGTYDVILTAADGRTKTVELTILANQQSLNGSDVTAYVGDPKPTLADFKASATGKDGKAVTVTADLSSVDMQKAGTYKITLTAADGQTKTVKLTVLNVLPIIYPAPEFTFTKEFVKDPTINLGTTFDPITGIYAWTDSTHSTPIPSVDWQISGNVNTNRAGAYTINYTITNAYGRTATLTRTITVAVNGPTESKTSGVVYVINNAGAVLYSDSATSISLGRTLIIATAWKYYGIVKDANGRIIAYNLGGKQYVKASDVSTSPFADRGIFTVRYPKNANWSVAVYDSHLNVLKLIPARSSWLTYGTQTLADGRTYFNLGGNQWVRTDYGYWRAQTN
ncbi:bacterial Ig-like domain-containing protein [Schleiferilactobacillus harbinensis]|uniref:bacterial Ig-like domain-containing protein n=1 Tax=Schleiferilactobacillus harbinensis TaxID=304207 RepID=UPI001CC2FCD6|nr:bacterial Ig-like domain-containing protein [Schleiferilactobacillus harbinensis]